ncbi:hypothetical protein GJT81_01040 [Enterobacteriaceae endosymbiont of Plateumaris consimilis]|uniref:hypothetical protein n=1 Tax=Enterobacteriaceae endosymbiont of Plateumaris consimilis TaxID=2675794 RepID=UPI001449C974|nr:hypothetical protein GJT81_01040 [Enterobacteriaceae endosymbiont of Plateumaris consimilis]
MNEYNTDSISYFGSVIIFNRKLNLEIVNIIIQNNYFELIMISSITNKVKILIAKKIIYVYYYITLIVKYYLK